jgi:hypothetical protein
MEAIWQKRFGARCQQKLEVPPVVIHSPSPSIYAGEAICQRSSLENVFEKEEQFQSDG